jgi:hypothetical protein
MSAASWFETHGAAVLLTMRVQDLILRSAKRVSKDEATEVDAALIDVDAEEAQHGLVALFDAVRQRLEGGIKTRRGVIQFP